MKISLETTPLDLVLHRLDEVTEDGDGWLARCPAEGHEDHHPSLAITVGDDGRVLVHCRSQDCPPQDIVAGMGLTLADLFPKIGHSGACSDPPYFQPKHSQERRRIINRYRYRDEDGKVLFTVGRTDQKDFPVWHPVEQGGYEMGLGEARRILYHLQEVLRAVKEGMTVHVCAGEKDADAVRDAGGVATTNPFGEGNWRDEYAEHLRGATVVLWQDKDPAGRVRTPKVVESLKRVGATVRVVEAADGKDAYDHLTAGKTLEELVDVGEDGDEPSSGFKWLTGPELAALTPEEPDYVLARYLARGLTVQLTGKVKGGKTTLAMHMAAAVLNKHAFLEES